MTVLSLLKYAVIVRFIFTLIDVNMLEMRTMSWKIICCRGVDYEGLGL